MARGVNWRAAPHSAVTTALPLGRATLILELLLIKELTTQFRHSKNAAAAPKQKGGRAGPQGVHKVVFWQLRVRPKPTCTNKNEYGFLKNINWKLIRKALEAIMEHELNVWHLYSSPGQSHSVHSTPWFPYSSRILLYLNRCSNKQCYLLIHPLTLPLQLRLRNSGGGGAHL